MRRKCRFDMRIELYSHQAEAVEKLHNGSVLCGDVGSGKSRTALVYFVKKVCGADDNYIHMRLPRDLYIITTAKKRDSLEWEKECVPFCIGTEKSQSGIKLMVDSWNNIKKYVDVKDSFFIFDEQRVVGYGAWTKSFLKITKSNQWILLSATPGDTWSDYIPLFIANGFYRNKTEFANRHIVYDSYAKFPKIKRYDDQGELIKCRNKILVQMKDCRETVKHDEEVSCEYDKQLYLSIIRDRFDPYDKEPITETGKLFYLMRKAVNSDPSRIDKVLEIINRKHRVIIFYNYTYELEMLRNCLCANQIPYAEWNGEKHEEIPRGNWWAYLVQYSAGAEGWNCIETDTIIFYSQSYSYRMTVQAAGRIDRMNTPYHDLYFYHLRSTAPIDIAIRRALRNKRNFNERGYDLTKL